MNLFGLILMHCFIEIFYTVAQSFLFNILSVNGMLFVLCIITRWQTSVFMDLDLARSWHAVIGLSRSVWD
jgi:hypothetical protein